VSNNPQNLHGVRVIIGLSGGVDSAVAAALLRRQGADVQALHMSNWDERDRYCSAAIDLQDARQVCEQLDIPLHAVNFAKEYREQVFDYFLTEYAAGRTPNPDVLCNREIKFGVFRNYAKRLGATFIATGHYARTRISGNACQLLKGRDGRKDQSYFLHAVPEAALRDAIFPLGELQKDDVRNLAHDLALCVKDKKDSTGICFIGERPFREFLSTYLPAKPGYIESSDGEQLGEHHGLMYYTLGQRQGLGIGGRRDSGSAAWYVAAKDIDRNALIVVQGDHPLRFSSAVKCQHPVWINGAPAAFAAGKPLQCTVKIRYRQADQRCTLSPSSDGSVQVTFEQAQADATPGQYAVFYDGDLCLGGGAIDQVIRQLQDLPKAS